MPDRIADALLELADAQRKLGQGLGRFTTEVHRIDRKRGRQLLAFGVGLLLLLGMAGVNLTTLQIVRCALSPGCGIYDRNNADSAKVVVDLVVEDDCRARRALAGMAAPAPGGRCVDQTPAAIYPGAAGP